MNNMSSAPAAPAPPADEQLIRLAVQNLACHPQAQRRYVQMGWMSRAIGNLQRIGGDLDRLVAEGKLEVEQAEHITPLRDLVATTLERRPDLIGEQIAAPREYLFSDALEDDDWEAIRQLAREVHHALAGESSVFVAIMAK
jgi:hypothetical protein